MCLYPCYHVGGYEEGTAAVFTTLFTLYPLQVFEAIVHLNPASATAWINFGAICHLLVSLHFSPLQHINIDKECCITCS